MKKSARSLLSCAMETAMVAGLCITASAFTYPSSYWPLQDQWLEATQAQNADQIIVLNDGKIEEMGTHDMLLKKQGHYYAMVQEQQKAKEWIVKGA